MNILPDINELDATLFKLDAVMGAAESHGTLCGMLCARGVIGVSEWMQHVLGEQEQGNVLLREAAQQMTDIHQLTMSQINDISAEFVMLLADDDDDMIERTEALATWCQGFIYGLAAGGVSEGNELPADTQELLNDFIEISRAEYDTENIDKISEEDEMAYVEIMEYVRTGVLLINEEMQPLKASSTLH